MRILSRLLLASTPIVGWAGPVHAQSMMAYTLELGGDNHAAQWKSGCDSPRFTGGDPADGNWFDHGEIITWSVKLEVSGAHSSGAIPQGAANMVVSLRLSKDGADYPITADGSSGHGRWFSTINNGTPRHCLGAAADPLELSAFPVSWNVDANQPEFYGRVIDGSAAGGPVGEPGRQQYPSAAGYPAGSTAPPGWLVGMGAGYASFEPSGCPDFCGSGAGTSTAGIGLTTPTACAPALGTGPVFEGQIDTTGMELGSHARGHPGHRQQHPGAERGGQLRARGSGGRLCPGNRRLRRRYDLV